MLRVPCVPNGTVDGKNPANHLICIRNPMKHGIFSISTGAGFLPSTVSYDILKSTCSPIHITLIRVILGSTCCWDAIRCKGVGSICFNNEMFSFHTQILTLPPPDLPAPSLPVSPLVLLWSQATSPLRCPTRGCWCRQSRRKTGRNSSGSPGQKKKAKTVWY